MFPSDKLLLFTVVVVTQLAYTSTCNTKPDVIRLVYTLDPFAVLGIRLDDDSVVSLSEDTSNVCKFLTLEILAYVTFQWCTRDFDIHRLFGHLVRSNCKEFESFCCRRCIKHTPIQFTPWHVRSRIHRPTIPFVRPEHSESRAAVDARVDTLTPFRVVWKFEEDPGS